MRGADVLEMIVRYTYGDGLGDRERGIELGFIASRLTGRYDGRKVSSRVRKLEAAGLIRLIRISGKTSAVPTERGLEVDATLAKITAARGGEFKPWKDTDLTISEKTALHG